MPYEIHIARINNNGQKSKDITLTEWKSAVAEIEGVRIAQQDDITAINPSTGEVIRIGNSGGDAEIYFPKEAIWYRIYRWREGVISFKGLPSFDFENDLIRKLSRKLSERLTAKIIGDGGEIYD